MQLNQYIGGNKREETGPGWSITSAGIIHLLN